MATRQFSTKTQSAEKKNKNPQSHLALAYFFHAIQNSLLATLSGFSTLGKGVREGSPDKISVFTVGNRSRIGDSWSIEEGLKIVLLCYFFPLDKPGNLRLSIYS
jgi:hypothetical protein